MTLHRRQAPLLLRAVNQVAKGLGISYELELSAICEKAEWAAGTSDYGHPGYLKRLARMVESARASADLTTTGRLSLRVFFHWHVVNRLKEVALLQAHPEILKTKISAPIIIVGGYRTGSTHLHSLLTQDDALRSPRTWELCFPTARQGRPNSDRARRRFWTGAVFGMNQFIMPDQGDVHEVLLDGPEECHFLLENAALSMTQYISFQGYDYANWLLEQDVSDAYDSMKAQYQILTWLAARQAREDGEIVSERPWVLKCPLHTWYLDELTRVFPDARLIWTHRPMVKTLPSTCGLTAVTASKFVNELDGAQVGRFWTDYYEKGFARGLGYLDRAAGPAPLHVHLKELSKAPMKTLERIYQHLGLSLSEGAKQQMEAYLEAQKSARDAPGKHGYTAEEFGLTEAGIGRQFAAYHERFSVV